MPPVVTRNYSDWSNQLGWDIKKTKWNIFFQILQSVATLLAVLLPASSSTMRARKSLSIHKQPQPDQPERQRRRYRKKGKTDLSESGIRCSRCDGRNIVFLRGEGRVYCNPCKSRFPPPNCDVCQHPETKPHHAKERRWRCLKCRKTFTVSGAGSPGKRRCGRKRKPLSEEEEDDEEFDCLSFVEPSIATNRPQRCARPIRKVDADGEDNELSDVSMEDDDVSEASEESDSVAEQELSSQESAVNASIDSFFDPASISDMQKIAARLSIMMAVYGCPSSFTPLLKELDELAFAFDRCKLVLCSVNFADLDPLENMAYASTLVLFRQTTYEVVSTLLDYTSIPYYRSEREVMRLVMQFFISVVTMKEIEFSLAQYMAKHICTLAHLIDRYCATGTYDAYILDVALIMLRLAAIYLASPLGSRTKLRVDECGKVFTTILRCLSTMIYRPLSQKPVWDILVTLKQHPLFSTFVMSTANSSQLREVIEETQKASSTGGMAMMSSVRDAIELCISAYLPSSTPDAPDQPARIADCRRDEHMAPSQAVL